MKFVYFKQWVTPNGKFVDSWDVFNHKNEKLGFISYFKRWKEVVWEQYSDVVMSTGCLEEVIEFMKQKQIELKEKK